MKALILLISLLLLVLTCCSRPNFKVTPEYKGVDYKAKPFVDEYIRLSKQNHIRFYNKVTIGFKDIPEDNVMGTCHYGGYFREIDIDIKHWNQSTMTTKMSLLFHEMTHCYCGRGHDYGKNLNYPAGWAIMLIRSAGYFKDGCPMSVMYPVIIEDACMITHYNRYIKEMFLQCNPW